MSRNLLAALALTALAAVAGCAPSSPTGHTAATPSAGPATSSSPAPSAPTASSPRGAFDARQAPPATSSAPSPATVPAASGELGSEEESSVPSPQAGGGSFAMAPQAAEAGRGGVYGGSAHAGSAMPQRDVVPRIPAGGAAAGPPVSYAAGCPVAGPVSFVDTWAAARAGGRTHEGTDMFAAVGTPVVAIGPGVVSKVDPVDTFGTGSGDLGGITVSYVTDSGDRWYNAHLSALRPGIQVGERLAVGTVLGFVGRSGDARTTPAHLHIEWHPGGGAAQPNFTLLRAACP